MQSSLPIGCFLLVNVGALWFLCDGNWRLMVRRIAPQVLVDNCRNKVVVLVYISSLQYSLDKLSIG
ncbi:hypothetical protein DsansV1_C36g0231991 [Dioscorea sansibarensis]